MVGNADYTILNVNNYYYLWFLVKLQFLNGIKLAIVTNF